MKLTLMSKPGFFFTLHICTKCVYLVLFGIGFELKWDETQH